MHEYELPVEIVRIVLAIGIFVSMVFYLRWQVTTGSAIVAGYLALFVGRPIYLMTTLSVGVLAFFVIQKVIAPRIFLYGRWRLITTVMVGTILQLLWGAVAYWQQGRISWTEGFFGVGFVLPGLIAYDMELQGVGKTLLTVLAVSTITFLFFQGGLYLINRYPGFVESLHADRLYQTAELPVVYSFHDQLIFPAVIISILFSIGLFELTGILSSGFLTAGYIALFLRQPVHLLFVLTVAILTYVLVTHGLAKITLLFGRTKYAAMVLASLSIYALMEVIASRLLHNTFIPLAGFAVIGPMIAALIANDTERQGMPKTLLGLACNAIAVFVIIKGLDLILFT